MNKKQLIVILISGMSLLNGCNYVRTFPLYSEVYVEHENSIKLDYYDNPDWWDYKNLSLVRQRIKIYLDGNPNISLDIKTALNELSFQKGMNKEQVILVIGEPAKKKILKDEIELWIYSGARGGVLQWYYKWGKLTFKEGILSDIEVQYINIHK